MQRVERDEEREHRITMEAIVDCYTPDEQALGWYYYLEGKMHFPFKARCTTVRAVSPLREGEKVDVIGMPAEEVCRGEMLVTIRWKEREMGAPLSQLEVVEASDETREGVADWHYWTARGHRL